MRLSLAASLLAIITACSGAMAEEKILRASFRSRPPELIINEKNKTVSGPLKDILDEAAAKIGYQVNWTETPFARSILYDLENGIKADIVPRVLYSEERTHFIEYLGPIGYQQKDILFLVKKGKENSINSYEDLRKISVGVKRGTVFFKEFDTDGNIFKVEGVDDKNMVRMFALGRFDAMIVLDKDAVELELKNHQLTDYSYANYKYTQKIANYYGMSKKSKLLRLAPQLQQALIEMLATGRIRAIYTQYKLPAPLSAPTPASTQDK
jgi:polar amino acid transport system substrate-binding protein